VNVKEGGCVNRFCLHCGAPIDTMSPQSPVLTCPKCGKSFNNPFVPQAAPGRSSAATLIVLAVVAVPFVVAVIGILAAIAIPNFIRFQAKAKQAECRTSLRSIHLAQEQSAGERGRYSSSLEELGFRAPPNSRYAYFVGPTPAGTAAAQLDTAQAFSAGDAKLYTGVEPGVADDAYVAVCLAQLDPDQAIDAWSVSSAVRTIDGNRVPAGEPFHHLDDVREDEVRPKVR
jgi:type II secretory pathway pseudopilin PulG